jgi:hypothetical protein
MVAAMHVSGLWSETHRRFFYTERVDQIYPNPQERKRHDVLHFGDLTDATKLGCVAGTAGRTSWSNSRIVIRATS